LIIARQWLYGWLAFIVNSKLLIIRSYASIEVIMAEDSSFQEFPAYVKKSSNKSKALVTIICILILIGAILAGGYYFFVIKKASFVQASPVPKSVASKVKPTMPIEASPSAAMMPSGKLTPTSKASLTPSPKLDRSKLRVAILNGSGVAGAAKEISSNLNSLGYTIATIGNADDFTYENVTIKIKKSKSDYLPLLKKDISDNDPKVIITTKLDDKLETDAEVIVGK
jgi:hypothetical protein